MTDKTESKPGTNNVSAVLTHPRTCKDLHKFNSDYDKWFKSLQGHVAEKLDPEDPRWTTAYNNGTIPCTALTDLGIQPGL